MKATHAFYLLEGGQSFAMAVLWTLATVYFVDGLKLDPLQIVLLGTALEGAYFLAEIPTGVVADVYSRRLSILVGVAVLGGSFVMAGLVNDFTALIATQIAAGIGFTFLSGATNAWLAGEIGEARPERLGLGPDGLAATGTAPSSGGVVPSAEDK